MPYCTRSLVAPFFAATVLTTSAATLNAQTADQTATWDNSTGNWSDDARWSTALFPNNGNGGFTYDAIVNSGAATLDQNITVQGLTLGGAIDGSFGLTVNDTFLWNSGQMAGTGTTVLPSGSTLEFGNSAQRLSRTLDHAGVANYDSGLFILDEGTFNNNVGGVFNAILSNGSILNQAAGQTNTFNNAGTFNKPGTSNFSISSAVAYNNSGQVNVAGGTLTISSNDFTNTGTVNVDANATLALSSNTPDYDPAGAITGSGNVSFSGGTHNLPVGVLTTSGRLSVNSTVNFAGNQSFQEVTLNGTLGGAGDLTVPDTLNWNSGQMTDTGTTVLPSGSTLEFGNSAQRLSRTLDHAGVANYDSGLFILDEGTFNNNVGGVFNAILSNGSILNQAAGQTNTFNNAGTFNKPGTSNFSISSAVAYNNSGQVNVAGGTLTISSNDFTNTGTVNVDANATLALSSNTPDYDPAGAITGSGNVSFSGGTHNLPVGVLTTSGRLSVNSTVNFAGNQSFQEVTLNGTLGGAGDLTVPDTLNWNSGQMTDTGTTVLPSGSTLEFGNSAQRLSRTLDHAGVANYDSGLFILDEGTFNNNVGGVFNASRSNGVISASDTGQTNTFNNAGSFNKPGTSNFSIPSAVAYDNSGQVNVAGGTLTISSHDFTNTGTVNVDANATLALSSNTPDYDPAGAITGSGNVSFSGGTHNLPVGVLTTSGRLSVNSTVNFAGNQSFQEVTLNGTLGGAGDLTVPDTLNWNSGQMTDTGTTVLPSGSTLEFGNSAQRLSRTLDHAGVANYDSGLFILDEGTFNNNVGGVFNASRSNGVISASDTGQTNTFNNAGSFNKPGTSNFSIPSAVAYNNSGQVNVEGGTLTISSNNFTNTGTVNVDADATLSIQSTAQFLAASTLAGGGTVNGDLTTAGTLAPDRTLTFADDLTLTETARLSIGLGGTADGAFDTIAVTGAATLAGALEFEILAAYEPQVGDSFAFLSFDSSTGAFDPAGITVLNTGIEGIVRTTASETVFEITAIPEPTTATLFLGASVLLIRLRRVETCRVA